MHPRVQTELASLDVEILTKQFIIQQQVVVQQMVETVLLCLNPNPCTLASHLVHLRVCDRSHPTIISPRILMYAATYPRPVSACLS